MITITVSLPPDVSPDIIDALNITVLDDTLDRQPRHPFLEDITRDTDRVVVTFAT